MKNIDFYGPAGAFVLSGSDDGFIYLWSKIAHLPAKIFKGDRWISNCIASHPLDPVIASSGIESSVKIWSKIWFESRQLDTETYQICGDDQMSEIVERNESYLSNPEQQRYG